jgi:tagatose-1,6-bisphosphate aldolase
MFNQEGKIIGNIIEITYDEIIYDNSSYNYNDIVNEIYEAIVNNAGQSNRCFYVYLSDDEKLYNKLNMPKFSYFLIKNLRL